MATQIKTDSIQNIKKQIISFLSQVSWRSINVQGFAFVVSILSYSETINLFELAYKEARSHISAVLIALKPSLHRHCFLCILKLHELYVDGDAEQSARLDNILHFFRYVLALNY